MRESSWTCSTLLGENELKAQLEVTSESGEFRVKVPLGARLDPTPQGTERILLVEDDSGVRRATVMILEDLGYHVSAFTCGSEALAALETEGLSVQLLLTDFEMPGLTGYELAQKFRTLRPAVKVLLTSGQAEESLRSEANSEDWPPFIAKPYSYDSLGHKLREVLDSERCHIE
jgi:two-component system cell cycle sensor histidine kinase/response regulator CckA